jgi:Ca2+-binding EF-hand superfamily protein
LPFFSLVPDGPAAPLVKALLARYDRNGDRKLSPDEVRFPAALFRRLDANGDGRLDAAELARWLAEPVDVELSVPLEPQPRRGVEVVPGRPATVPVLPTRDGVQVILADWTLSVDGAGGTGPAPDLPATSELAEVFRMLDADGNGYLDSKELYRPPFTYVSWLRLADRDGDGRLSMKEFLAFAALQGRLKGTATFLRVDDEGRSLFRLLDTDRDGRLGRRELLTAWQRLARWDREGKGVLSKEMLPQTYRVVVRYARPFDEPSVYGSARPIPRPERGPLWFRKMDRNGDGDVSLREWLGTRQQFERIDRNGDGLIGLEEALAADRWFRRR